VDRRLPLGALVLGLVAVAALVGACGDDTTGGTAGPTGPTATPNESNTLGIRQCDLLTATEVSGVIGREVTAAPYAENHGDTAICRYSADGRSVAFLRVEMRAGQAQPSLAPEFLVEGLGDTAIWINFVNTLWIMDGDWLVQVGFEEAGDGNREQAISLAGMALPRLP
jgi:hypothetical protein